jgi:predicted enzyme related to lactoylglutathione lyase
MTEEKEATLGTIAWRDLTVPDAERLREFYCKVVGWSSQEMDGDFNMIPPGGGAPAAGICYARGPNARLPPQWLMYVLVEDVEASARIAVAEGGTIVDGPRVAGFGKICVIRDPAGAVLALYGGSAP